MKLLHTSDWHLGHNLMNKGRQREHKLFLNWLINLIQQEDIDVLIVAGDIFDSFTPANYAFELYYDFLRKIPDSPCNHVIITGGNHDSISTLNAPKELLKRFNVHVIGGISDRMEEQIIEIVDQDKSLQGLICAVPFLRERDVRVSKPGESYEEKSRAYVTGVQSYYQNMKTKALEIKSSYRKSNIPIIATGHLFITGSRTSDGERDLYVGTLGEIPAQLLPQDFNYFALGHLHCPQTVANQDHMRYSGSPIPLSFSEINHQKQVIKVDVEHDNLEIKSIAIPVFQDMKIIRGNLSQIENEFLSCKESENGNNIWVEVQIENELRQSHFQDTINSMAEDKPLEVLAVKFVEDKKEFKFRGASQSETHSLKELEPLYMFRKYLAETEKEEIDSEEKQELIFAFQEIVTEVHNKRRDKVNEN